MSAALDNALQHFHKCTIDWFSEVFDEPTKVQDAAWPVLANGGSGLLLAPTGSGKTLAAFLAAIDRLMFGPEPNEKKVRVLYISPLKALGVDVDRNLRAPLAGLRAVAQRDGVEHRVPTVGVRSGDTSQEERRFMARNPPEILITTPESLYLLLTSRACETLDEIETVIIDEIHALAGTKRGTHLFLSLERLERLRQVGQAVPDDSKGAVRQAQPDLWRKPLQRVGLSATQRPLEEIARLLGGCEATADPEKAPVPRPVEIIDASEKKRFDLRIETPADELSEEDEDLARHLRGAVRRGGVQTEKGGIDHADERVVDLEVADVLDALGLHVVQRPAGGQGTERTAVPVRVHREDAGLGEQEAARLRVERRQDPLREHEDAAAIQAEAVVVLEEAPRRLVVERAGHDVPGDRHPVAAAGGANLLGKDPEERLSAHGGGGVGALGTAPPQAGALAPGDGERREAAGRDEFLTRVPQRGRRGIVLRRVSDHRLEVRREHGVRAGPNVPLGERIDLAEVEGFELREQPVQLSRSEPLGKAQHVVLCVGFKPGSDDREPIGHVQGARMPPGRAGSASYPVNPGARTGRRRAVPRAMRLTRPRAASASSTLPEGAGRCGRSPGRSPARRCWCSGRRCARGSS